MRIVFFLIAVAACVAALPTFIAKGSVYGGLLCMAVSILFFARSLRGPRRPPVI